MMKRILLFMVVVFSATLLFSCSSGKFSLANEIENIKAGESVKIELVDKKGTVLNNSDFLYASSNPEIVNVSADGTISGAKQGKATVFVQSAEDKGRKLQFDVNVFYDVVNYTPTEYTPKDLEITHSYGKYKFWLRNDYTERVENWDVADIAKIVAKKTEGEYVFTDLHCVAEVKGDVICLISDWTSDDVVLSSSMLDGISLSSTAATRTSISEQSFSNIGCEIGTELIRGKVADSIRAFQGKIALSELPEDEYRVSVKIDYTVYRTDNFYSKGLLKGIGSFLTNIFKWNIDSFLSSYTYSETVYEIEVNSCDIVIEKR